MGTSCCCLSRRSDGCLDSVVPFCSDEIKNPCRNLLYCMCCFIMYVGVSCRVKYRDWKSHCCCTAVEEGDNTEHKSVGSSNNSTIRRRPNEEINGAQPMADNRTPSSLIHPDDRTPISLKLIRFSQLTTSTHSS